MTKIISFITEKWLIIILTIAMIIILTTGILGYQFGKDIAVRENARDDAARMEIK